MYAGSKARVAFEVVTWSLTALVLAAWVAGLTGLAVVAEQWASPLFIVLGVVAGICLGAIRDRRVFQVSIAVVALLAIVFAAWLSSSGASFQEDVARLLYPFLAASVWTFAAVFALARLWSRERPEPVPTPEEIDQAVARPRMGV